MAVPRRSFGDCVSWHALRTRFDNPALNGILFGTFTVITSTFFYRYSMLQSSVPDKAKFINLDNLLLSSLLLFVSALLRYLGHFVFLHLCPTTIETNRDVDDLLKKAKDTMIDDQEWPILQNDKITYWNIQNYKHPIIRKMLGINEILVFLIYLLGIGFFFRCVFPFARQLVLP
jgi:hypothetical protein